MLWVPHLARPTDFIYTCMFRSVSSGRGPTPLAHRCSWWWPIVVTHKLCVDQPRVYRTTSSINTVFWMLQSKLLGQNITRRTSRLFQVLSFKDELATVCVGLLSHCRGCMRKSGACCHHSSLSGITMSRSELEVPRDQPIPCIEATLTIAKEGCY